METQETIKQIIKQLALDAGFKLREQTNGEMDLNPYVYEFAVMLQTPLLESIRELQGQNRYMLSEVERMKAERNQLAAQNERLRSTFNSGFDCDINYLEWEQKAKAVLAESTAVSLANIQADQIDEIATMTNQVADKMAAMFAESENYPTNAVPIFREYAADLTEAAETKRQQAQEVHSQQQGFTCKHGTILYGTSCMNCDCERAQEAK